MASLTKVLQELKAQRVQSVDIDADVPLGDSEHGRERRYIRTTGSQWRTRRSDMQSWKKRPNSRPSSNKSDSRSATTLGVLVPTPDERRRKSDGAVHLSSHLSPEQMDKEVLYQGMLYKTTRAKITSDLRRAQSEHRQWRRFQLTEHSLEYSQLLQRVCHANS